MTGGDRKFQWNDDVVKKDYKAMGAPGVLLLNVNVKETEGSQKQSSRDKAFIMVSIMHNDHIIR